MHTLHRGLSEVEQCVHLQRMMWKGNCKTCFDGIVGC